MFDRQSLHSGAYLRHFDHLPPETVWSPARIEASLQSFLARRPDDGDEIWVFGYGSLIWNPMVIFEERVVCRLDGWRRSFCLPMIAGRGTPETPGRMLSLEEGGRADGVALRLVASDWRRELAGIWVREMVTGAYEPAWLPVRFRDGRCRQAVVFTANLHEDHWDPDSSPARIAPMIEAAQGPFGSNAAYVARLHAALQAEGMHDDYVEALVDSLAAVQASAQAGVRTR